jgi:hypothetical protein
MLLGFPLDYWNNDSIQNAPSSFGRMIMWENDRDHLARLMVRARVTDLQEVPYFLVLTEAEGFQGGILECASGNCGARNVRGTTS